MSSTSTTLRARPARDPSPDAAPRRRPVAPPDTSQERRPALEVIVPGPSRLRRRLIVSAASLAAIGILFGLVLVHVELTAAEMRLVRLQARAAAAEDDNLRLRLTVSQLQSPARIVATAQQLGMVPPPKVTYLAAVPETGPSDGSQLQGGRRVTQPAPAEGLGGWALTKRIAAAP